MKKANDQVFTVDELAVYLKVSKSTLYKLLSEGKVPGQKVGRHWRFSRTGIDEWLKEPQRKMSQAAQVPGVKPARTEVDYLLTQGIT